MATKPLFHALLSVLLLTASLTPAAEGEAPKLTRRDKCPVCGMFVYNYPDWVGAITFKDGFVVFFDGAKDLFKYYFNPNKYNPKMKKTNIKTIYVTEYYIIKPINALEAFFVIGSDVYGPMARELIPFASQSDAREFMKDHKSKRVLEFPDVKPAVIMRLDE